MNDLKSQHAVESNGMRHIVGGQCDSAYALDHRDTLHMIRSVRAHRVCHRLSRCFKYDFREFFWWHFRPRAVKCANRLPDTLASYQTSKKAMRACSCSPPSRSPGPGGRGWNEQRCLL